MIIENIHVLAAAAFPGLSWTSTDKIASADLTEVAPETGSKPVRVILAGRGARTVLMVRRWGAPVLKRSCGLSPASVRAAAEPLANQMRRHADRLDERSTRTDIARKGSPVRNTALATAMRDAADRLQAATVDPAGEAKVDDPADRLINTPDLGAVLTASRPYMDPGADAMGATWVVRQDPMGFVVAVLSRNRAGMLGVIDLADDLLSPEQQAEGRRLALIAYAGAMKALADTEKP